MSNERSRMRNSKVGIMVRFAVFAATLAQVSVGWAGGAPIVAGGFEATNQPVPSPEELARQKRILGYLKGTPSEKENPRSILVNRPFIVFFALSHLRNEIGHSSVVCVRLAFCTGVRSRCQPCGRSADRGNRTGAAAAVR